MQDIFISFYDWAILIKGIPPKKSRKEIQLSKEVNMLVGIYLSEQISKKLVCRKK